ncbi:MAG: hypothetical protein AAFV71_18335 [Cyanobacteria bacterium J06633_8]
MGSQPETGNQSNPLLAFHFTFIISLCDELEAKLRQSIGDRENLMSAAVRQDLAA